MHSHSDEIATNVQFGRFLRRVHSSRAEILEYNRETKNLSVWPWPIDTTTEERVTPEDLRDKLAKSGQSSPQCLCPILNPDVSLVFQASIIRAEAGLHTGQLVVRCSSNQCGYVAPLERIYKHGDHPRSFEARDNPLRALATRRGRALKRSYAFLDITEAPPPNLLQMPSLFTVARMEAPVHHPTTNTDFLTRLDSWTQPGLYESEFRGLMGRMAQCTCGMIMMRDVFSEHRCKKGLLRPLKKARRGGE